jgi:hypothetical protein
LEKGGNREKRKVVKDKLFFGRIEAARVEVADIIHKNK